MTFFQFKSFLKKSFNMLSQCLVPSITKKFNSYSLVLALIPFKYKILIKVFIKLCILKPIKTFLIQNYYYRNATKYQEDKKTGTNFDDNRFLNLKTLLF